MIKGVPVTLISKIKTGTDPFGAPIYSEIETVVENILVAPTASDDVINRLNLTGRKAVYTLAIPKGDTHIWENQEVIIFGEKYKVVGPPLQGIENLIPSKWNKKVTVERYD